MALKKKRNRPLEEVEDDIRALMERLYNNKPKKKSSYNKKTYEEKAKRLKEFHSWFR